MDRVGKKSVKSPDMFEMYLIETRMSFHHISGLLNSGV